MTLSKIAQNILKSPNEMLQIDHSEKKAIEPEHIYVVKGITSLDNKSFSKELNEIRYIVS